MPKSRSPKNPKEKTSADSSGTLKSKPTTMEPEIIDPDRNVPPAIKSMLHPGSGPVTESPLQSLLDILNGESAKMSAALQNPSNWPGIMQAAKEAPAKIAQLEQEMGIERPIATIGPVEVVDERTALGSPPPGQPQRWNDVARMRIEDSPESGCVRAIEVKKVWPDDRGTLSQRMKRAGRRLLRAFRR